MINIIEKEVTRNIPNSNTLKEKKNEEDNIELHTCGCVCVRKFKIKTKKSQGTKSKEENL